MSGFGDFGSNYGAQGLMVPSVFGFAAASGGAAEVNAGPVPDNQTWVLLGADAGASTAATPFTMYLTLLNESGDNFWWGRASAPFDYAYAPLDTTPPSLYAAGVSWRGAVPYRPGYNVAAVADATPTPDYVGVILWGIILPYPT